MQALLLASVADYAGKNLLALGIFRRFEEDGLKVGYFRPLGVFPIEKDGKVGDEDALFAKQVLRLKEPLADLCPVIRSKELDRQAFEGSLPNLLGQVETAYKKVAKAYDVVVVPALGDLHAGGLYQLAVADVARRLKAQVLLVARYDPRLNRPLDGVLGARKVLRQSLLGAVLNRVPPDECDAVAQQVRGVLTRAEIPLLGVLPEDAVLSSCTIKDVRDEVGGEFVVGRDKLGDLIETYQIGAMNAESALGHFRKARNKAVVMGSDRPDIQLAAMETHTRLLILTGGGAPNDIIVSRASSLGTAIIVSKDDTRTVASRLSQLFETLSLRSENKVKQAVALVRKHLDFARLYDAFGYQLK